MAGILDVVALRSLASIADSGGFRKAADALHLSQSAVSQHVRRLEQVTGRVLVERNGRATQFTADGELLIEQARKILAAHDDALTMLRSRPDAERSLVIGATEHGADVLLQAVTAHIRTVQPATQIRYRIDRGRRLNDRLDDGGIDAAVLLGPPRDRRGGDVRSAGSLPLAWYAAPSWQRTTRDEDVPLVVIDGPCTIRARAIQALSDAGLSSSVICETGHLAGVHNAARAGLGVALLTRAGAPYDGLEERSDLPPVAPEPLHVRTRRGAPGKLVDIVGAAVERVLTGY